MTIEWKSRLSLLLKITLNKKKTMFLFALCQVCVQLSQDSHCNKRDKFHPVNLVQLVPLMCWCALLNKLTVFGHLILIVSIVVTINNFHWLLILVGNDMTHWNKYGKTKLGYFRFKKKNNREGNWPLLTRPCDPMKLPSKQWVGNGTWSPRLDLWTKSNLWSELTQH